MSRVTLACLIACSISAVAVAEPVDRQADLSKNAIEAPTERLVDRSAPAPQTPPPPLAPNPVAGQVSDETIKVKPGKVAWHASADDACEASRVSGKPVLLLQLLGQLDEHFT